MVLEWTHSGLPSPLRPICDPRVLDRFIKEARDMEVTMVREHCHLSLHWIDVALLLFTYTGRALVCRLYEVFVQGENSGILLELHCNIQNQSMHLPLVYASTVAEASVHPTKCPQTPQVSECPVLIYKFCMSPPQRSCGDGCSLAEPLPVPLTSVDFAVWEKEDVSEESRPPLAVRSRWKWPPSLIEPSLLLALWLLGNSFQLQ